MKVIAIGDPHFRVDNIPEVNLFIDKIEELCKKENPDFIVILGDVLHTHERIHTVPLNKAYEFIERLKKICQIFVLVGNHDMTSNQNFLNENHWMNGMKQWDNIKIVDKLEFFKIDDFLFTFLPYVPPGRFIEALNSNNDIDWKNSDCIFAHQEFFGSKMGCIISMDGDKWDKNFPSVISGHIHNNQTIDNIYYPGSSMQNAFGESDKNIIPIITFYKNKKYDLSEIDLCLPRKKIIYTDIENIDKIDKKINNSKLSEDKIKISLSGVYDDFKAFKKTTKYKDLVKNGVKVVFKTKKEFENKINKDFKDIQNSNENNFSDILYKLILKEKNNHLYQLYEEIVNSKIIDDDDIFIL